MNSIKLVIKNTGYQYIRMIVSIIISLYSVRLVLQALGVEDYGIYSLIAGVILTLSFLNGAMTVSTQRYLSFYLGQDNSNKLIQVFQTSVTLHLFIGILIVIILELLGIYLFNGFLNIPPHRIGAAKIVYQCMVISTFFTINAVPYDSTINAHEDLLYDAIVGIIESFIKLILAIWLLYYNQDRLVFYAITMALSTIIIRIIKSIFCNYKYKECSLKKLNIDISLFKEMVFFTGWNTFGAACAIVRSQGLAVVLNIFYGTAINAAYGISMQINWQLRNFSLNMLKALRPQIIKSEGYGDRQQMLNLSLVACRFGFFLMAIFAIPMMFEMKFVLNLWLKDVPANSIIFSRLIIILSLVNLITIGLQTALQATGKIKTYQTIVGSTILFNLPIAWLLLFLGLPSYSVLISAIGIEIIASIQRIYFAILKTNLSLMIFIKDVLGRIIFPLFITCCVNSITILFMNESFIRLMIISIISFATMLITIFYIGMSEFERKKLIKIFKDIIHRFKY